MPPSAARTRLLLTAGAASLALAACYRSHAIAIGEDVPDAGPAPRCAAPAVEPVLVDPGAAGAVAVRGCDLVAAVGSDGVVVRSEDGGKSFEVLEPSMDGDPFPALAFAPDGALHLAFEGESGITHRVAAPGAGFGPPVAILPGRDARIAIVEPRAHHAIAPFADGVVVGLVGFGPSAASLAFVTSGGDVDVRQVSRSGEIPGVVRVCAAGGVVHAAYVDAEAREVRHVSGAGPEHLEARAVAQPADAVDTGWTHADVACFPDGSALVVYVDGGAVLAVVASRDGEIGSAEVLATGIAGPFYPHVEARADDALVTWSAAFGGELGYVVASPRGSPTSAPRLAPDLGADGEPDARPVHCATSDGYVIVAQSHAELAGVGAPVHGATVLSPSGAPLDFRAVVGPASNASRAAVGCAPDGAWVLATADGAPLVLRHLSSAP